MAARAAALMVAFSMLVSCSGSEGGQPEGSSATPSSAITSTAAAAGCSAAAGEPTLPETGKLFLQPELISGYLNAGGDVDRLLQALASGGLLPEDPKAWPAAIEDLDGDGQIDVALAVQDLTSPAGPRPSGSLFIWLCREGRYDLLYQLPPETDHSAPLVLAAADLTGDGASEVVFGRPACGAHTCFLAVGVLQWDGSGFTDLLRGSSEDLPAPEVLIRPPSASGPAAISITSHGVQSVGAGPPRSLTRRWIWTRVSGAFVPDTEVLAPPVYRIHRVHDADEAFLEGDYASAEELYTGALEEDGPLDWTVDPATPTTLAAYIRYRGVLNLLAQADIDGAQAALDDMAEASMGIPEADPFVEMAEILLTAYRKSHDLASACREVVGFAEANPSDVLEPLYYGYANPTYAPRDVCPVN